jgi:RNA polymerase sigma-70 factor (ECF subfamily)
MARDPVAQERCQFALACSADERARSMMADAVAQDETTRRIADLAAAAWLWIVDRTPDAVWWSGNNSPEGGPPVTPWPSAVLYVRMDASSMTLPARGAGRSTALSPAFERLFRAEYARVVSIAHRVLADQDGAEDVAQDVFLSFYRAHSADAAYAAAWLHAAAAHSALNALRARGRRTRREAAQAISFDAPAGDDPADTVTIAETRDEVRAVLARLPERSAAILALRSAGLSYSEIAAALDVRASSIGTLLRRAEESFRREMQ